MARGWESKSVEEQQSEARAPKSKNLPLAPQEAAKEREKQGLNLSRHRVLGQLQLAHNPAHRQMLEKALADLDARLAQLA